MAVQEREGLIAKIRVAEEADRIKRLLRGAESLRDFIIQVEPRHAPPRHLECLISKIEEARIRPVRICVSMPPGHAKSITLQRGLAWWLKNTPTDTCGYFSYNDDIGCRGSNVVRGIAREINLPIGSPNTANEWRTVSGGGLVAGGIGTSLTGRRITGLMVVDDPIKDRKEAESATTRQDCWDWFNSVVMTRLEGASVIVLHTRWHDDDLIGRLEKHGGWEVINIPAICNSDDDPFGRQHGEALWPEQYPAKYLADLEHQIGEYEFAALFQGSPRTKGARVFGEPRFYSGRIPDGCMGTIGVDPAASKSTTADYSVAVAQATKGRDNSREVWIPSVLRRQVTIPNFVRELKMFQSSFNHAGCYIEAVGGFKAVPQMLKDLDESLRVFEAPVFGDKFQRAQPFAAAWNDGRVYLPENAPWVKDYVAEMCSFTGVSDKHDDQVDASAHGFNPMIASLTTVVRRGSREDVDRYA